MTKKVWFEDAQVIDQVFGYDEVGALVTPSWGPMWLDDIIEWVSDKIVSYGDNEKIVKGEIEKKLKSKLGSIKKNKDGSYRAMDFTKTAINAAEEIAIAKTMSLRNQQILTKEIRIKLNKEIRKAEKK